MKKNLKITGKVLFERPDFIKMITEVLQATEDLQLERVVPVDREGNAVDLHSLVCYVHQIKSDEIPDKYDPAKTISMPKGITRPNRGLSKLLKEVFQTNEVSHFNAIWKEVYEKFPHLTKKQLKLYLSRPEMTGCKLEIEGDEYWNPNGENPLTLDHKREKRNG